MKTPKINRFRSVVLTFAVVYGLVEWGVPAVSRQITSLPFPLTVPGALMFIYMLLTAIALFLFVTFSDEYLEEFLAPVRRFLAGGYGERPRTAMLTILPLLFGWYVYDVSVPKIEAPLAIRIQHPSSNFPQRFEDFKNPFARPSEAEIETFIEEMRAGNVPLIAQAAADVERWQEENPDSHMLAFLPAAPVQQLIAQLENGDVDTTLAGQALVEKNLFEGRILYAMNCRPCHGDSVSGDGPMADAFKLRPINFTESGTLETIVEGYTFWRVATGGQALPTEATPWDSAMPEWQLNLTEEERWKIILAEYDLAEKTPRIPESH